MASIAAHIASSGIADWSASSESSNCATVRAPMMEDVTAFERSDHWIAR